MLWFMRRPWIKVLQRRSTTLFGKRFEEQARRSLVNQNRFARRHGLVMLTVALNMMLASFAVTGAYFAVIYLYETGTLTLPERLTQR
jgi:hypothetical protein